MSILRAKIYFKKCFKCLNLSAIKIKFHAKKVKFTLKKGVKMSNIKKLTSKIQSSRRYPYFYALQTCLKHALSNSPALLQKRLAYQSQSKCVAAVKKLCACDEPYEWLDDGHYDFTHTSLSLLEKCADIVGEGLFGEIKATQDEAALRAEIERARLEAQRLADLRKCVVQAVTDFRFIKGYHSPCQLAFSGSAGRFELTIKEEWLQNGVECALKEMPQIICQHFKSCDGKVRNVYGAYNIIGYKVFYKGGDGQQTLYFDTKGARISDAKFENLRTKKQI